MEQANHGDVYSGAWNYDAKKIYDRATAVRQFVYTAMQTRVALSVQSQSRNAARKAGVSEAELTALEVAVRDGVI